MSASRATLSDEEAADVDAGRFVRVELVPWLELADDYVDSVLVGVVGGELRAYANICRHRAVPLSTGGSPMSHDGLHLYCGYHGALYRPTDGRCVVGPCVGESLLTMSVQRDGRELVVSGLLSPAQ